MGAQGTVDDPEELPYYMQAVGSGYAGTSRGMVMPAVKEEDTHEQAAMEQSVAEELDGEQGSKVMDEYAVGDTSGESCKLTSALHWAPPPLCCSRGQERPRAVRTARGPTHGTQINIGSLLGLGK